MSSFELPIFCSWMAETFCFFLIWYSTCILFSDFSRIFWILCTKFCSKCNLFLTRISSILHKILNFICMLMVLWSTIFRLGPLIGLANVYVLINNLFYCARFTIILGRGSMVLFNFSVWLTLLAICEVFFLLSYI